MMRSAHTRRLSWASILPNSRKESRDPTETALPAAEGAMPSGRPGRGQPAARGLAPSRPSMARWVHKGPDHQLAHAVRPRYGAQARRRGPGGLRRRRPLAVTWESLEVPGGPLRLPLAAPRHGGLPRRARADRPRARDRRDRAGLRRDLLHLDPDRAAEPLHQGLRIAFSRAGPSPRQGRIPEAGHPAGASGP